MRIPESILPNVAPLIALSWTMRHFTARTGELLRRLDEETQRRRTPCGK